MNIKQMQAQSTTFFWAMDFARCVYGFGKIRRWLFRTILGRYAFREFIGMVETIRESGHPVESGDYWLEGCDYHKEKVDWNG